MPSYRPQVAVQQQNIPKKIPIMEIFGPTIQGEGSLCGSLSTFIRTGGCGLKCTWCDTMWAVDPAQVKENAKYLEVSHLLGKQVNF